MSVAPDTGRTAEENELREALVDLLQDHIILRDAGWMGENSFVDGFEEAADALLSGPLAPILQEAATARKERDEARASVQRMHRRCQHGEAALQSLVEHLRSGVDVWVRSCKAAEQEAATLRARLQEAEKVGEALRETLKTIAQGEVMTFDEGLGFEVSFWMDEEEMSALARAALATPVPQNQEAGDHEPR